jgi:hypothetical protein
MGGEMYINIASTENFMAAMSINRYKLEYRINNKFTITKTTKCRSTVYNSPTTSAQGRREGFAFSNLAVRQDFFNNKLNLTFLSAMC